MLIKKPVFIINQFVCFIFQINTKNKDSNEDDVSKYYFYFAFENSICKDYISEKVFRALEVDFIKSLENIKKKY